MKNLSEEWKRKMSVGIIIIYITIKVVFVILVYLEYKRRKLQARKDEKFTNIEKGQESKDIFVVVLKASGQLNFFRLHKTWLLDGKRVTGM